MRFYTAGTSVRMLLYSFKVGECSQILVGAISSMNKYNFLQILMLEGFSQVQNKYSRIKNTFSF